MSSRRASSQQAAASILLFSLSHRRVDGGKSEIAATGPPVRTERGFDTRAETVEASVSAVPLVSARRNYAVGDEWKRNDATNVHARIIKEARSRVCTRIADSSIVRRDYVTANSVLHC